MKYLFLSITFILLHVFTLTTDGQTIKSENDCSCKNLSINEDSIPFRQRVSKYLKKPNLSKLIQHITPVNKTQFEDLRIIDADIKVQYGKRFLHGKVITKNYLDFKIEEMGGLSFRLNPCLIKGKHAVHLVDIELGKNNFKVNFREQYIGFVFPKQLFNPTQKKSNTSQLTFKPRRLKVSTSTGLSFDLYKDTQFTESKIGKTKITVDFNHFRVQKLHEKVYTLNAGGLYIPHLISKLKYWFKSYEVPLKRVLIGADYFYGELTNSKIKYRKGLLKKLKKNMTYVYETEGVLKFYYTTQVNPSKEVPNDIMRLFKEDFQKNSRTKYHSIKPTSQSDITGTNRYDNRIDYIEDDDEMEMIEIVEDSHPEYVSTTQVFNFAVVDEKPVFPGCESLKKPEYAACFTSRLSEYINKNLVYPKEALEQRIEEKIYVSFEIDVNGNVRKAKVVRGNNKLFIDEAIRLINKLPRMKPALYKGKVVNVNYTVPFRFKVR